MSVDELKPPIELDPQGGQRPKKWGIYFQKDSDDVPCEEIMMLAEIFDCDYPTAYPIARQAAEMGEATIVTGSFDVIETKFSEMFERYAPLGRMKNMPFDYMFSMRPV